MGDNDQYSVRVYNRFVIRKEGVAIPREGAAITRGRVVITWEGL